MTDELLNRLAERRWLIIVGEIQYLTRDCIEYLRHFATARIHRQRLSFPLTNACRSTDSRSDDSSSGSRYLHNARYRALNSTVGEDC